MDYDDIARDAQIACLESFYNVFFFFFYLNDLGKNRKIRVQPKCVRDFIFLVGKSREKVTDKSDKNNVRRPLVKLNPFEIFSG